MGKVNVSEDQKVVSESAYASSCFELPSFRIPVLDSSRAGVPVMLTVPGDGLLGFRKVCRTRPLSPQGCLVSSLTREQERLSREQGEAPILPGNEVGARARLPPLSEAAEVAQLSEAGRVRIFNQYHPTAEIRNLPAWCDL